LFGEVTQLTIIRTGAIYNTNSLGDARVYVCICNGYRDAEIREAAREGARCAHEAYWALGNGPCCGRCLPVAQSLIDRVHGEKPATGAFIGAFEPVG
jgi:bacterioferritin-associated ferredoxin